jgi:hypothetical protein
MSSIFKIIIEIRSRKVFLIFSLYIYFEFLFGPKDKVLLFKIKKISVFEVVNSSNFR